MLRKREDLLQKKDCDQNGGIDHFASDHSRAKVDKDATPQETSNDSSSAKDGTDSTGIGSGGRARITRAAPENGWRGVGIQAHDDGDVVKNLSKSVVSGSAKILDVQNGFTELDVSNAVMTLSNEPSEDV